MSFRNGWFIEKKTTNSTRKQRSIALKDYSIENSILFEQQSLYHHILVFDSALYGYVLVIDGLIQIFSSSCDNISNNNVETAATRQQDSSFVSSMFSSCHDEMMLYVPILSHRHPHHICLIGDGTRCGTYYKFIQHLLLLYETNTSTTNSVIHHITLYEKDVLLIHVLKMYFTGYYPHRISSSSCTKSWLSIWDDPRLTIISDIDFFQQYHHVESSPIGQRQQHHQQQQQQQQQCSINDGYEFTLTTSRASDRMLSSMMNYDENHHNIPVLDTIFSSSSHRNHHANRNTLSRPKLFDIIYVLRDPYPSSSTISTIMPPTISTKSYEQQCRRRYEMMSFVRENVSRCLYHALLDDGIIVMTRIPSSPTFSIDLECLYHVFHHHHPIHHNTVNNINYDRNKTDNDIVEYALLTDGSASSIDSSEARLNEWKLMLLIHKKLQQQETSIVAGSRICQPMQDNNNMMMESNTVMTREITSPILTAITSDSSCHYPMRTLPSDIQDTLQWYSPEVHESIFILPSHVQRLVHDAVSSFSK